MHYPRHIAIIPDGNRTRAKDRDLPTIMGHQAGFQNAKKLAKHIFTQTPIEVLTLRWASTENIAERSPNELEYLYEIYQTFSDDMHEFYIEHGIGYRRIGSPTWLPSELVSFFRQKEQEYPSRDGKYIVIAVNYGGRDEIIRWVNQYITAYPGEQITESGLSEMMDLGSLPPVDLVIRSKGESAKRISWFMSRWIGYAELYFFEKYFPDFNINELHKSLVWFDSVVDQRNFGK